MQRQKRNTRKQVSPIHVLVADDDDALRRLMVDVLRKEDYEVSSASGGKEALEDITKGQIDVALVDVKMPDMNGMEVLRRAKELDPDIEIIVITGFADMDTVVEAVRRRAYDFLRKPFEDITQIPALVRRAGEKRRMKRENARLSREVRRHNRLLRENVAELTLLYELSKGMAHVLNQEKLSDQLLDRFLSLTKVQACSSLLLRQVPPVLVLKSRAPIHDGCVESAKRLALQAAAELSGCQLEPCGLEIRHDVVQAERRTRSHSAATRLIAQRSERVVVQGETVGVLSIYSLEGEKFAGGDVRLFSLLARQASRAMEGVSQAIQAEKSRIAAMIESMAEGIAMVGQDGEILVLNPAAKEMLGLNGSSAVSWPDLCHRLQELGLGGGFGRNSKNRRWEGILRGGETERVVQAEMSEVRTSDGEWLGDVLVMRDVTKEKESERLKAEFVSTVSHELRTPLTGIKNITSNLLKGVAGEVSEKQRQYLQLAEESAERLRRLIDDLLCVSRIEARKLSLKMAETDIGQVIQRVLNTFESVARKEEVGLEASLPARGVSIVADTMRLEQVLNNLVENAIKFTPKKGRVGIEVVDREEVLEVAVSDTGRGIPKGDQQKVFERFHQVEREEGAGPKGTGLGLTIVKELVEMHGGRIWVEVGEEKGSRFVFTLPKKAAGKEKEDFSQEKAG